MNDVMRSIYLELYNNNSKIKTTNSLLRHIINCGVCATSTKNFTIRQFLEKYKIKEEI